MKYGRIKHGKTIRRPWSPEARLFFEAEGLLKPEDGEEPKTYTVTVNKLTLTYRAHYVRNRCKFSSIIRVDKRFPPL
ncbi:hypothetical protein [Asticcacaulis sp. YBE204]|uniref:hypothetical protein n=1 Tax=Asticcacaulis sp. YBE204 TaxID=1282363 RepID=UPI0003C3E017|nr:hypothetical protein [Asticcacaulis sp. YBE204]ESQ78488.1 hypothetical protein AEYBE204_13115 [Asticcacaulis sp. YBE204]